MGNEPAMQALWTDCAPVLAAVARAIAGEQADDIVQHVFMKLLMLSRRDRLKVIDPLAWLVTVTRNEARNAVRARVRRSAREKGAPAGPGPDSLVPESAEVLVAMADLDELSRTIIMLRHRAQLPMNRIAAVLEMNANTIGSVYRRAIESLRTTLEAHDRATGALRVNHTTTPRDDQVTEAKERVT